MSRNNDVFQVLVTKGNKAVLGPNKSVTELTPGQIGVFNFESGMSLGPTSSSRNFFIAVGTDAGGAGVTTDIRKSAGSHIQGRNIAFYSYRPYQAGQAQEIDITNFKTVCGRQYGINIHFNSEKITKLQGAIPFKLPVFVESACCDGCGTGCETGDDNLVAKKFHDAINANTKGLVKAVLIDPDGAIVEDYDTFVETNKEVNSDDNPDNDVKLGVRITAIPEAIQAYSGVDTHYIGLRDTFMNVTMAEGFECSGLKIETSKSIETGRFSTVDILKEEEF